MPLLSRRERLQALLAEGPPGLLFSEHMEGEHGEAMLRHACRLGLEGIVSKKVTASYLSGRRPAWLKIKNPDYERAHQKEPILGDDGRYSVQFRQE